MIYTIIAVVVIIIIISILFTMNEPYCNCTGMGTSVGRPPYTFWRGAETTCPDGSRTTGWQSDPGRPFLVKNGGTNGYQMGCNEMMDLYRDQMDGLNYTVNNGSQYNKCSSNQKAGAIRTIQNTASPVGPCGSCGGNDNSQYVSLQSIGASPPVSSVTTLLPTVQPNMMYGGGAAPPGPCRLGGYQQCGGNPTMNDLAIGVL